MCPFIYLQQQNYVLIWTETQNVLFLIQRADGTKDMVYTVDRVEIYKLNTVPTNPNYNL